MHGPLSGETRLFPIIGDPIRYVKIPPRLTSDFAARGHNGICIPMQVQKEDLEVAMRGLTRTLNVDGVLITMPHKSAAFSYCATSSERAKMLRDRAKITSHPGWSDLGFDRVIPLGERFV
jgi:shikimate dehydrogenase